jgi:hypothetical protein
MSQPETPETPINPPPGPIPQASGSGKALSRNQRLLAERARRRAESDRRSPEVKAAEDWLEGIGTALADVTRWRILLELGKGAALPVGELAKRTRRKAPAISRHLALLRRVGLVENVYTTCYALPSALQPAPGATVIDLGPCLLKLDAPR